MKHFTTFRKYVRNYPVAMPGADEPGFDCITEFWFDDIEGALKVQEILGDYKTEVGRIFLEDEERFQDRGKTRSFLVDERVSGPVGRPGGARMKVLVTGGLGNVGRSCLAELLNQGQEVTCFDLRTKANVRRARSFADRVRFEWGDLRQAAEVAAAVRGQQVVAHTAFILPPATDERPDLALAVNVGGTRNLIAAMKEQTPLPRIIFISSFSVYGRCQEGGPPRTAADPVQPMDNYNRHKVECEAMVRDSGLDWTILRLGVVPPKSLGGFTPKMFDTPPGQRTEFVHPDDVGLAVANAAASNEVWGRILLIGGGQGSQLHFRDFAGGLMEAMGIGRLPDSAFAASCVRFLGLDGHR